MTRSRSIAFLILIGAVVALVLAASPGSRGETGEIPTGIVSPEAASESDQSTQATIMLLPGPTELPLSSATPSLQQDQPTPTPLSVDPSGLQTPVTRSTSAVSDATNAGWNPPPLNVPIARHPFDHYWLIRPVASDHNNFGLVHYPYGSNGPGDDLRIHHGIDLANPVGVEVHAAAAGTVIWADKGHYNEYESITAYGNTVVIEHDFGYNGQIVYTLYAHLSALLVQAGQRVESGHTVGLIGSTGQVSGPHVHFEVRVGRNSYFAVRNPELWMAPYAGTGVIAGRLVLDDGTPAYDTPIMLIDRLTGRVVYRTNSYAGFGINSDDNWQETFVIADVPVGRYLVTARYDRIAWAGEVEVIVGVTNWVEMERLSAEDFDDQMEPSATPATTATP